MSNRVNSDLLAFAEQEKEKRAAEVIISNTAKAKRAAELVIANAEKAKSKSLTAATLKRYNQCIIKTTLIIKEDIKWKN